MTEAQFRILGPLAVATGGRQVALGGPRQRRLLAVLLLHAGQVMPVGRLVEAVWEDEPPASAEVTLRTHVAKLRRSLVAAGLADVLVTRPPGYGLRPEPEQVDAHRFESLVSAGRAALERGDAAPAARSLRKALELWRGPVLADLDAPRFAEAEAARLEQLRLVAWESRIDADLALGHHEAVIPELETLVAAHPFSEHLCCQLMLALYRSGRQADALEVCRGARQRLDEELGLRPGQALSDLETAILRHDQSLDTGVAAPSHVPPSPDALFSVVRRVPMAGRSAELARLRTLWREVAGGARRVVLVTGEAGVGKTRLAAELVHLATAEGGVLLVGRCEQAAPIPYHPVAEALRDSPAATEALAQAPQDLRDRLAGLVEGPARLAAPAGPRADDLEHFRAGFFDAVGELVTQIATTAPVVFVVEEGESIDRASARLLRRLAGRLPARVLLLICLREPPGSLRPPLRELIADVEGHGLADRVELGPLPEGDLAALVAAWTGEQPPTGFVHTLWSSTGGNPFFASEVVRELAGRGGISGDSDAWRVPGGVRDVLRERLRTLSVAAQQVVECAAVLGRDVDVGLLLQVAEQSEESIADALGEAGNAGWLVATGRPWEARYAFRHQLMREAVHTDIPAPRRQRLHLRCAGALEAAGLRRPADVAAAAVHLRASGPLVDRERAAELSLRAADEAAGLYAWDEAVAHAEAAVAILALAGARPARQADALVRAAGILIRSSVDYRRAIEHLEAALELHRSVGDETAVASARSRLGYVLAMHHSVLDIPRALAHFSAAEVVLTDGTAAFEVQFGKAQAAMFALQTDQGYAASQRAADLAAGMGRPDLVALARPTEAIHRFNRGHLTLARTLVEQGWQTAQDLGGPHLAWETVTAAALMDNMYLLDPAASRAWCRRGLAQPRFHTIPIARDGVTDHLAYALASMGQLAAAREAASGLPPEAICRRLLLFLDGDWEAAERSWATALDHDLDNGDLLNAALNAYWLGQVRRLLGRVADAEDALRHALTISLDGPQVPAELMVRAELVRLLAARGDVDEAATYLKRCQEILAAGEDWRGQAGNIALAHGAVAAATGQEQAAAEAHRQAQQVFTTYRLPWYRSEALHAWADWLAATGRRDLRKPGETTRARPSRRRP